MIAAYRACILALLILASAPLASAIDFFARTDPDTLPAELSDLPIVTVAAADNPDERRFVIWLSGDGGWSQLERETTAALARAGVPTAGINTLRYFRKRRSPEDTAQLIARIADAFGARWERERFVLVGFSFGADVGALALAQLSPRVRERLDAVVLLSPSARAWSQVGPPSWLGIGGDTDVRAALADTNGVRVLCVRGVEDRHSACDAQSALTLTLPGGHTLHGDGARAAEVVLRLGAPASEALGGQLEVTR